MMFSEVMKCRKVEFWDIMFQINIDILRNWKPIVDLVSPILIRRWIINWKSTKKLTHLSMPFSTTPIQMGVFGAAHRWCGRGGGGKPCRWHHQRNFSTWFKLYCFLHSPPILNSINKIIHNETEDTSFSDQNENSSNVNTDEYLSVPFDALCNQINKSVAADIRVYLPIKDICST